jgi:hypothetical protein
VEWNTSQAPPSPNELPAFSSTTFGKQLMRRQPAGCVLLIFALVAAGVLLGAIYFLASKAPDPPLPAAPMRAPVVAE